MAGFDSPIGSKKFQTSNLKEYEIPDEQPVTRSFSATADTFDESKIRDFQAKLQHSMDPSNYQSINEGELRAQREARRNGKDRLSEAARKRVEMLLGMTRLTRDVTIGENVFVLQTLRSKEMSEAYAAAAEYDGTVQSPFEIRRQLLSRSLVSIANIDFSEFVGSTSLDSKLYFIDLQDHALLIRLFTEYNILEKEANDKYAIKNAEDAKDVLADIKK